MKRLETDVFQWPETKEEVMEVSRLELGWLLSGLDFTKAHEKTNFSSVI
jgi:hypothetical protein